MRGALSLGHRCLQRCLFCALLCLPQAAFSVDVVSAASRFEPLPAPDGPGVSRTVVVDGARLHLFIEGRPFDLSAEAFENWLRQSAAIVAQYYGGFPIDEAWIAIRGTRGTRVVFGRAIPTDAGAAINVTVGLSATPDTLAGDWILIHELVHLAFPTVPRRHHWLEEGLSVYVESIARVRVGDVTADQVWAGFIGGMHNGLAREGDKGLDFTPTWGRTYWGGALFCLIADVRIREQSGGRKTLRDALRAIVDAGYNMTKEARLREVLQVADDALGVPVLTDLYEEMRDQPVPEEIDSLWISLGVSGQAGEITYDDDAPRAGIRRALTQPL